MKVSPKQPLFHFSAPNSSGENECKFFTIVIYKKESIKKAMKGLHHNKNATILLNAVLQRFLSESLSKFHWFQAIARLHKTNTAEKETKQEQPTLYMISILHRKPEIGEDVRFLSTYYAEETKDASFVKQIFSEAFHKAHPSWIIEEVTVESISQNRFRESDGFLNHKKGFMGEKTTPLRL